MNNKNGIGRFLRTTKYRNKQICFCLNICQAYYKFCESIINSSTDIMSCFSFLLRAKSFIKNQPRIKSQLALLYKQKYQNTIFYEICQSSLRYITQGSEEQFPQIQDEGQDQFQRRISRKSGKSVSHYQDANINFNSQTAQGFKYQSSNIIPVSIQNMSFNQKQQLLKSLIQKSYLFIDLSDLLSGQDLQTYDHLIKKQIFEGQQSLMDSIIETAQRKGVKNKLKYFDSQALHLLKNYVDFCDVIIQKLRPFTEEEKKQRGREFLPHLILQLKAKLQQNFPDQSIENNYTQLNKFVKEYKIMIDIILSTIQKIERIKVISQDSHQYAQNFFTYPNLSVLISVVLFRDQNFLRAIFVKFIEGLKICASRIGQKILLNQDKFIEQLKSIYFGKKIDNKLSQKSSQNLFAYKSNLQKIIQGGSQDRFPYFKKSLRTLQTLSSQKQPITCLKIIYELNKMMSQQHNQFVEAVIKQQTQFQKSQLQELTQVSSAQNNRKSQSQEMRISQKNKDFSFSRETQILIIQYLLSRKKDKIKFIIANILITYLFVHQNMLKDKKGSCLTPFLVIIENYGMKIGIN